MPLDDIEIGRLLQKMDEIGKQLDDLNLRMNQWQPIIDEAQKQQTDTRSAKLSLTVAAIIGFSLWITTMAVWYIQRGGAVPVQTTPPPVPAAHDGGK